MFATRRMLTAGLLAAALLIPGVRTVGALQDRPSPTRSYLVRPGDTLWSIARASGLEGDRRAVVQRILEMNEGATARLHPGQELRLPLR